MQKQIIGCIANFHSKYALELKEKICKLHPEIININKAGDESCDILIVLGGDGFFLRMLSFYYDKNMKFFGLNAGNLGFLINKIGLLEDLYGRIGDAAEVKINYIEAEVIFLDKTKQTIRAFNEIGLLRNNHMAMKASVIIDGNEKIKEYIGDGIMLSTPIGSTAYNLAAGGRILPLDSHVMSLTPICPIYPKKWTGAIISESRNLEINVLRSHHRKVKVFADNNEYYYVQSIKMKNILDKSITLLYDKKNSLRDKILNEQFPA